MATRSLSVSGEFAGQIQESFLNCTICLQLYTKPKALPCLHTFCEGCLRDYVCSRYGGAGQFPCPVCRQDIYIPPNGVAGFPDNHFIISLLDTINSKLSHGKHTPCREESVPLLPGAKYDNFELQQVESQLLRKIGSFGTEQNQFLHISGLAHSAFTDDIVIADCSLNKICIYSSAGQLRNYFYCDCSVRDVAVTRAGTILISVSRAGPAILREYGFDGRLLANYGTFYKYENPFGVAVTNRNKTVVTGLQQNCVHVFTERRKPSVRFGSRGSGPNHFILPHYVTVNSRDDIIVTDSGNHRIKVHSNDGTFKLKIGKQGSEGGDLFYPMGVCCDKYDNIYVADANNYRVQMFSPEGELMACPLSNTYEFGVDVKPTNVLFLNDDQLLVALRGTKFCEVHVYKWEANLYRVRVKKGGGLCCCLTSTAYDDL